MKRRSTKGTVKTNQAQPVIAYPPGYKGQPLTEDLIMFSDSLMNCPADYRGLFVMLVKQFAAEVGCGNTEVSRDYFEAISCDRAFIWCSEDLPTVLILSVVEQHKRTRQRVLRIMTTQYWIESNEIPDLDSEGCPDDSAEIGHKESNTSSAKAFQ